MFCLTRHSTHYIYGWLYGIGFMVQDHQLAREDKYIFFKYGTRRIKATEADE